MLVQEGIYELKKGVIEAVMKRYMHYRESPKSLRAFLSEVIIVQKDAENNLIKEYAQLLPSYPRLDIMIEKNLTHGKGYDGIQLQRKYHKETVLDVDKTIFAMDVLEGKINQEEFRSINRELWHQKSIERAKERKKLQNYHFK